MNILYAYTDIGALIRIDQVDKSLDQNFYCCNCGKELIARKGKVRRHHFAHKSESSCSYESYLHKLGKEVFYVEYTYCLENDIPFYLEYRVEKTCISCKEYEPIQTTCKLEDETHLYDLTDSFDRISKETSYDGFIADILLISSNSKNVLLIEFAVTHSCEREKIDSGHRIIEFSLDSEMNIMFVNNRLILLDQPNVKFYNLKTMHIEEEFIKKYTCTKTFDVFLISSNNRSAYTKGQKVRDICEANDHHPYQYYRVTEDQEYPDEYSSQIYEENRLNNEFAKKGYRIRNCYVCRFCALNLYGRHPYPRYCKLKKKPLEGNLNGIAAECNKFWMNDYN